MVGMKKAKKATTLPDDLVEFGILPCLPAKALLRMKCVSKAWNHIISTPHPRFFHMQSQRPASGLVCLDTSTPKAMYLSRDPSSDEIQIDGDGYSYIAASCNGILCVHSYSRDLIFVGNPSLKNWKKIPVVPSSKQGYKVFGLAVNVEESCVNYRLVALAVPRSDVTPTLECEFYVFSPTSGNWHEVKERLVIPDGTNVYINGLHVNGSLYWKLGDTGQALWFNVKQELHGLQPLPSGDPRHGHFGECGDKLSYAMIKGTELQMWTLDQTQWSKRVSVTLEYNPGTRRLIVVEPSSQNMNLGESNEPMAAASKIFMMASEGGDFIWFFFKRVMYCYDIHTGVIHKKMGSCEDIHWYPYKSTLISLPVSKE